MTDNNKHVSLTADDLIVLIDKAETMDQIMAIGKCIDSCRLIEDGPSAVFGRFQSAVERNSVRLYDDGKDVAI